MTSLQPILAKSIRHLENSRLDESKDELDDTYTEEWQKTGRSKRPTLTTKFE